MRTGVVVALMVPLMVAFVAAILAAQAGPHDLVLAGVPRSVVQGVEVVSDRDVAVTADAALALARERAGDPNADVRQVVLGRYSDRSSAEQWREMVVWFVNFADPGSLSMSAHCGFEADYCNCNWAYHAGYVVVEIDATDGSVLGLSSGGGFIDPSIPATGGYQPTDNVRERCQRLLEEQQEIGNSP